MKKIWATIAVLILLFNNCAQEQYLTNDSVQLGSQSESLSSLVEKSDASVQHLAIVEHWDPAGPEAFVRELVQKLPRGTAQRKLAFTWVIDALQTTNATIEFHISECFRVAQKYQIPFILHVNHEWLFPYREISGDSLVTPDVVEWVDWNRKPLKDWWSDWSVAFEGKATRFPPRMSLNHPDFIQMNQNKAAVIKAAIAKYGGAQSELFAGIDSGWETGIEPDYNGQLPAYNALIRRGFSAAKPPVDLSAELASIAAEFVKKEIDFYRDQIPAHKLFTHILIYDGEKGRRQPTAGASHSGATPGFSLDINGSNTQKVKALVGTRDWAITESWRGQGLAAKTLNGEGLPSGLRAPKLVVLYTWSVDIRNNANLLSQVASVLNNGETGAPVVAATPTPAPTTTPKETLPPANLVPKGSVDIAGPGSIEGWAFDPNEPDKSIDVHIYFDSPPGPGKNPYAILKASSSNRLDINSKFGITGLHGFIFKIPSHLSPKVIYVYAIDTKDPLQMSSALAWAKVVTPRPLVVTPTPVATPAPVPVAAPVVASTPTLPNVKPKGYIEVAGPTTIEGWAFDPNEPSKAVDIHLYFATGPSPGRNPDVVIKAGASNRQDINAHFGITGSHGIYYQIPSEYRGKKVFIFAIDTQDPHPMSEAIAWDRQL